MGEQRNMHQTRPLGIEAGSSSVSVDRLGYPGIAYSTSLKEGSFRYSAGRSKTAQVATSAKAEMAISILQMSMGGSDRTNR